MTKRKKSLAVTEIVMILLAVIWFIPIYYLIVTTLKSPKEATASPLALPKVFLVENYVTAWQNMQFPRALGNAPFPFFPCGTDRSFPDEYRKPL